MDDLEFLAAPKNNEETTESYRERFDAAVRRFNDASSNDTRTPQITLGQSGEWDESKYSSARWDNKMHWLPNSRVQEYRKWRNLRPPTKEELKSYGVTDTGTNAEQSSQTTPGGRTIQDDFMKYRGRRSEMISSECSVM